jgi:iduronate 2-sulfatase
VSLREESAAVPLIICVPNQPPGVCNSLVELLDLYPTIADLCGLEVPQRLQGKNIKSMLSNPEATVRESAFSVAPMRKGFLLRENDWAYIQYGEDAANGIELYDMNLDPKQYNNVAKNPAHAQLINQFKAKMKSKMAQVRTNDLPNSNKQKKRKKQPKQ